MFLLLTIKSVIFFKKYPSFLQIKIKKETPEPMENHSHRFRGNG